MTQQPRRRRRIFDQSTELSLDPLTTTTSDAECVNRQAPPFQGGEPVDQPAPVTGRRRRTRDQSDELLSEPPLDTETPQVDPTPAPDHSEIASSNISSDLDYIRAELLEDQYHSDLAESDYSDDTHDWGWDSQTLSDHYWHFLGKYE